MTSDPETIEAEAAVRDKPWSLLLICCGREGGTVHFAAQAEAELFRSGYTDPSTGHDRQAILRGPDVPKRDPGDVLAEYLDVIAKGSGLRQIAEDAQTLLHALLAERERLLKDAEQDRDLSGWTDAENARFEELYGVQAAMRLRLSNDRVWQIVQELRLKAVEAGLDPYQDPMAQRLSAALVHPEPATGGLTPGPGAGPDTPPQEADGAFTLPPGPIRSHGLMTTLQRVSGLNTHELGRLFGVSANAVRLWQCGGRINRFHYERALDLNERMQQLPAVTFYDRRKALMDSSSGRSIYDQMLAELTTPALDPDGEPAYFAVDDGTPAGQLTDDEFDAAYNAVCQARGHEETLTRERIIADLEQAAELGYPHDAAWNQTMHQAAYIVDMGLELYLQENPRRRTTAPGNEGNDSE